MITISGVKPTETYLILGNGFDLELGLPTRYTDYLAFLTAIKEKGNEDGLPDQLRLKPGIRKMIDFDQDDYMKTGNM